MRQARWRDEDQPKVGQTNRGSGTQRRRTTNSGNGHLESYPKTKETVVSTATRIIDQCGKQGEDEDQPKVADETGGQATRGEGRRNSGNGHLESYPKTKETYGPWMLASQRAEETKLQRDKPHTTRKRKSDKPGNKGAEVGSSRYALLEFLGLEKLKSPQHHGDPPERMNDFMEEDPWHECTEGDVQHGSHTGNSENPTHAGEVVGSQDRMLRCCNFSSPRPIVPDKPKPWSSSSEARPLAGLYLTKPQCTWKVVVFARRHEHLPSSNMPPPEPFFSPDFCVRNHRIIQNQFAGELETSPPANWNQFARRRTGVPVRRTGSGNQSAGELEPNDSLESYVQ
nr:hypothetical protein Iba_chr05fCG10030 [Ipomoea batatas]